RPLIDQDREIAVGLYPARINRTNDRLGGRTDGPRLLKFAVATVRNPGDLGCEAFDMVRFTLEHPLRDEQREVGILNAGRFDTVVERTLNVLPESVPVRSDNL